MKKKNKRNLQIGVIILLVGIIAYFGFIQSIVPSGNYEDYSSNFYSLSGNQIILDTKNDDIPIGYIVGVEAVGVNAGGRNWINNFLNEGKELSDKCTWTSTVIYTNTGQSVPFNTQGNSYYDDGNLYCHIGKNNFFGDPDRERYMGVVVTWTYAEPEQQQTYYRFEDNQCTQITILPSQKTSNDYETLSECESNIVSADDGDTGDSGSGSSSGSGDTGDSGSGSSSSSSSSSSSGGGTTEEGNNIFYYVFFGIFVVLIIMVIIGLIRRKK